MIESKNYWHRIKALSQVSQILKQGYINNKQILDFQDKKLIKGLYRRALNTYKLEPADHEDIESGSSDSSNSSSKHDDKDKKVSDQESAFESDQCFSEISRAQHDDQPPADKKRKVKRTHTSQIE